MAPTTPPVPASTARRAGVLVCALVVLGSGAARAEQASGNTVNPVGLEPWRPADERGLTLLLPHRRRTPSGFLYPFPAEPLPFSLLTSAWTYRGSASVGFLGDGGDEDETRFERYADWDDGALVTAASLELRGSELGDYLQVLGGSVGRGDQFYRLEAGRPGRLQIRGSFSRTPHRYASDAVVLFAGKGTESLTLPGPPGTVDLGAAVAASGESRLEVRRDRSRLSARWRVRPELSLVGSYGFEQREGEHPFGGAFSFPQITSALGGVVETAAPRRDHWHDISAGLEYGGEVVQTNLVYAGTFFRNERDQLAFDDPFDLGGTVAIDRGRFALAPNNDAHRVTGDLAVALPLRSRLKATVSWQTLRQDDDLLPPTINSVTVAGVDLATWSTPSALSQGSADARIDTLLVDATLEIRPRDKLRVRARYRRYQEDNDTRYVAFNPGTGEYGYIVEDGGSASLFGAAFSGVFQPGVPANDFPVRNAPYQLERQNYELSFSYRLGAATALELAYEGESVDRDFRERDETQEDRVRLSVSSRRPWATLRVSYELAERDVSSYDPGYRTAFTFAGLPGFVPRQIEPAGLRQLERPALAGRRQQLASLRANLLLADSADLSFAAGYRNDDYSSRYGPESDWRADATVEGTYQPSPRSSFHAYGTFERRGLELANIRGVAGSTDPNAGGPAFPLANAWSAESDSWTLALGTGVSLRISARLTLESDYSFLQTREEIRYRAASPGALAIPSADLGSHFPLLENRQQTLETSLRWALAEDLAVRIYHRYDSWKIADWAQTTLVPLNGQRLFFAHRDDDFEVSVYGLVVEKRF